MCKVLVNEVMLGKRSVGFECQQWVVQRTWSGCAMSTAFRV